MSVCVANSAGGGSSSSSGGSANLPCKHAGLSVSALKGDVACQPMV